MIEAFLFAAATVFVYMTVLFVVSVIIKRNDLADLGWGPGFLVIAVATIMKTNNYSPKVALITLLVALWAARLAIHIWPRLRRKQEDFRYAQWRKQWGKLVYIRSFVQVFMLQGLLMLAVASSIITNAADSSAVGLLSWLGILVWIIGFCFEAISDRQLTNFLNNPNNKSKLMTHGLWKYSRHPNYFGEVTQWWGLWLIVLPSTYWFVALISPLTITVLILFVSGIPILEKKFAKQPGYKEYADKTSIFIPLPPRH